MDFSLSGMLSTMVVMLILTAMIFLIFTDVSINIIKSQVNSNFEYESFQKASIIDNFVKQALWLNPSVVDNGKKLILKKLTFNGNTPEAVDVYIRYDTKLRRLYYKEGASQEVEIRKVHENVESVEFVLYTDRVEVVIKKKSNLPGKKEYKYTLLPAFSN